MTDKITFERIDPAAQAEALAGADESDAGS